MGYTCCIGALFAYPGKLLEMLPLSEDMKALITEQTKMAVDQVNEGLVKFTPFQLIVVSVLGLLAIQYCVKLMVWLRENLSLENVKTQGFRLAAKIIPQVKAHIEKEMNKMEVDCVKKYSDIRRDYALTKLPKNGLSQGEILKFINKYVKKGI